MTFQWVKSARFGLDLAVPDAFSSDERWLEGADELLEAALQYYNEALTNFKTYSIPKSLSLIEQAIQLFPYCPKIIEFAVLLHLEHGDLARGNQLAGQLGLMTSPVNEYSEVAQTYARQWNETIEDPSVLLRAYEQGVVPVRYREVALLFKQHATSLPASVSRFTQQNGIIPEGITQPSGESASAKPPSIHVWQWTTGGLASLTLAMAILLWIDREPAAPVPAVVEAAPVTSPAEAESELLERQETRIAQFLTQAEQFERAAAFLYSSDGSVKDGLLVLDSIPRPALLPDSSLQRLSRLLSVRLAEDADRFWSVRDYSGLYALARNLPPDQITTTSRFFYQVGYAAKENGDSTLALMYLTSSFEEMGNTPLYYDAEVIYQLALLSSEDKAPGYAKLIREKYGHTIYNNSRIANLLQ